MSAKKTFYGYVAVVFSMIFWGISFVWTKQLLDAHFPVFLILVIRLTISSLVLFSVFSLGGKLDKIKKKDIPLFVALAFFEPFLYFIGENFSMKFVDASFASIMIATLPVVNPIALWIFNGEKIKGNLLSGVLLSVAGICLMSLGDGFSFVVDYRGVLLLLLAVAAGSGYTVMLSRLIDNYGPVTITTWQNILGAVFFLPCFLIFDLNNLASVQWSFGAVLSLVMLALLCSSGAFMLYAYGAKTISIMKVSVFTNAIPVVTIIFAICFGMESLTWNKAAGILIVVGGLLFSQFGFNKKSKQI